jgi:ABC-type transport system involved in multi-copper enzyme maturation permease subunit
MNLPTLLRTIRWMIRDTFRQSLASKLFWGLLAVTLLATLFCLSISVQGDMRRPTLDYEVPAFTTKDDAKKIGEQRVKDDGLPVVSGEITLGFGLVKTELGRHREDAVLYIEFLLAGAVADTLGVLLALLWTAGFLPSFLEPQSATVLLAKPAPRWSILLGKYLGVVLFVALQAALFVGGTWLALGVRTGVWNAHYWLAVPLLAMNFAIFYAVSVFFAVVTRNVVPTLLGTLIVWLVCWTVNYGYLKLTTVEAPHQSGAGAMSAAYWVLPKPIDLGAIFYEAQDAHRFSLKLPELQSARALGKAAPETAVATSLLFALLVLAAAAYEFHHTDY